jgi:hypothetical protein
MSATRRFDWAALLGPPLAIAGFLSYFAFFYRWPALRDVPWANFALLAAAVALSALGLRRAARRRGRLRQTLAALGLGFSGALALSFVWYVAVGSRDLPDSSRGLALGAPLPALTLLDPTGTPVELTKLEQPLVLVFYRGFW